jgi:hypothetical protein
MNERDGAYVAVCDDLVVEAIGESREQAVAALLVTAQDVLRTVEAVGPPSRPPDAGDIELGLETPEIRGREAPATTKGAPTADRRRDRPMRA